MFRVNNKVGDEFVITDTRNGIQVTLTPASNDPNTLRVEITNGRVVSSKASPTYSEITVVRNVNISNSKE